jgi:16S rRNA (adenine1518-N6/adenine1519-N6)-dimethyltransferase
LRQYGLRPNKGLGQNFLVDQRALRRVVAAAAFKGEESVLEIGAGLGSLTYHLAKFARDVIAVEFDRRLIPALKSVVQELKNVRIIQGNILELDLHELIGAPPCAVIGNIPYNITSALIRQLLETEHTADFLVLTLQKEVVNRIAAHPGEMSLLALSVQLYGNPKIAGEIPAESFFPKPEVDSAILRVDVYPEPLIPAEFIRPFFQVAKAGFSQRRKQLKNSLSAGMAVSSDQAVNWLAKADIDPKRRPQELSLEEWCELTRTIYGKGKYP